MSFDRNVVPRRSGAGRGDARRADPGVGPLPPDYALVAELDGAVVGHVDVSDVDLATRRRRSSACRRSPSIRAPRRGIGSALVREVAGGSTPMVTR